MTSAKMIVISLRYSGMAAAPSLARIAYAVHRGRVQRELAPL